MSRNNFFKRQLKNYAWVILALFLALNAAPVFADTQEEYLTCIRNCYADENNDIYNTPALLQCRNDCKTSFPSGYQAFSNNRSNIRNTADIGTIEGDGQFRLNVPVGDVKGFNIDNDSFGKYFSAWYGFILGAVGILATAMIMWGGFKYLTSRGDKGMIDSAKTQIISAITGVVLAFGSYTLLNLVNPALLTIRMPVLPTISGGGGVNLNQQQGSHGTLTTGSSGGSSGSHPSNPCLAQGGTGGLDTNAIPASTDLDNNGTDRYDFTNSHGVDPELLEAIALHESGGNPNAVSNAGACGLMQLLPSTAGVSCNELISNPGLSIDLAAAYIANMNSRGITRVQDQIAGYIAGSYIIPGSALSASRDCAGKLAWECCDNPGGMTTVQNYVYGVYGDYQLMNNEGG